MLGTVAPLHMARVAALIWLVATLSIGSAGAALAQEAGPSEAGATSEPAAATDEHGGGHDIESIGTQNEVSKQYLPPPSELPKFQRVLYIPLTIVGLLVIAMLLFRYLQWQPRFAEERRSKRRR